MFAVQARFNWTYWVACCTFVDYGLFVEVAFIKSFCFLLWIHRDGPKGTKKLRGYCFELRWCYTLLYMNVLCLSLQKAVGAAAVQKVCIFWIVFRPVDDIIVRYLRTWLVVVRVRFRGERRSTKVVIRSGAWRGTTGLTQKVLPDSENKLGEIFWRNYAIALILDQNLGGLTFEF